MTFSSTFGRVLSPTFHPKSQVVGGGFLPTDITGCLLWYDFSDADTMFTDAGTTKVTADGNAIYQINDKSASGINATQATSGARPTYKTNVQNGLSLSRYDGGDQLVSGNVSITETWTLFAAVKRTNTSAIHGICGADTYPSLRIFQHRFESAKEDLSSIVFSGAAAFIDTATGTSGSFCTTAAKRETNAVTAYVNGTGTSTSATGTPNSGSRTITIGNCYSTSPHYFLGDICEFIFYNTALSDADRGKVETYLNNKWAIY